MIQFNLLPDIKLAYIRAKRTKRLVTVIASTITLVALMVLIVLLLMVDVLQKQHLSRLDKDIKSDTASIKAIPDIDKILTVQNQLDSLPQIHNQKPATSRLFSYLTQVTPAQASIATLNVDFSLHTIALSGNADSLSTVNKFVDTLKFTDYKLADSDTTVKAFNSVVLASFSKDAKESSYKLTLNFEPTIFDNKQQVSLVVPKIITTRSEVEKPLFKQPEKTTEESQ